MNKTEIVYLSEDQIDKIIEYISLAEGADIPTSEEDYEAFHSKTLYYLNIIKAFNNDAIKAAQTWNKALELAREEMDRIYEDRLRPIKKPTHIHFYEHFNSKEDADAYKEKIGQEASKAYEDVMNENFYHVLDQYWDKESEAQALLH